MLLAIGASTNILATSADTAKLEIWAAVGAVFGVVLFIRGFLMLRLRRQIMNTPASKVRSASMGLVEVNGLAKGPTTIPAGITRQACYYYRADVLELRDSGRNREWKQVASESVYVPFFVEDPTGRLLIDPQGAEMDIHCSFRDEYDTSFFRSNRDMLPENVASFLARKSISFSRSIRVEEYCISPDYPLFVFGTLGKSTNRASWEPVPHMASGSSIRSGFNLFGLTGSGVVQSFASPPAFAVASPKATVSVSRLSTGSPKPADRTAAPAQASSWSSVSMDDEPTRQRVASSTRSSSAQSSPLQTNPASVFAPVAIADPDPAPESSPANNPAGNDGFDPHPSVCISKGPSNDPFVISWRSQREVVQSLAWRSALCIWGGPALTLACLYFLTLHLGWR